MGMLKGDPAANDVVTHSLALRSRIGSTPQVYSDPKKQALMNYYYQANFNSEIGNMTHQRYDAIMKNDKFKESLINTMKANAVKYVEGFKMSGE